MAYKTLLAEADAVCDKQVQDIFRWSTHPFEENSVVGPSLACQCAEVVRPGALSCREVAAVLQSCKSHGFGDTSCAVTVTASAGSVARGIGRNQCAAP